MAARVGTRFAKPGPFAPARAAGVLFVLLLGGQALGAIPAESPTSAVQSTLDAVFKILEDETLKAPGQSNHRRELLEGVIAKRFDYEEMSKRTLAKHWRPLTQAERQEFVQLFKKFLSDKYAGRVENYSGEKAGISLNACRTGMQRSVRSSCQPRLNCRWIIV